MIPDHLREFAEKMAELEPGEICPTCDRTVPVPMEKRPQRGPRAQWNITFESVEVRDSARLMYGQIRERLDIHLGTKKRVRDGDLIIYVAHDWLT